MELDVTSNPAGAIVPPSATPNLGDLPFALYSAWLSMHKLSSSLLNNFGLTYPQYLVMSVLREKEPMSVSKIGELVFLESSTLSPLLKRLEHEGLLSRKRDSLDERIVLVALSPSGKTLLAAAERQLFRLPQIIDLAQIDIEHLLLKLDALRSKLVKAKKRPSRSRILNIA
jgi:DNA-binding MarR family transcriptional regulator